MKSMKVIIGIVGAVLVVALGLVIWKMTDHTKEFRNALHSRNVGQVEKLLKQHPSLANARNMDGEDKGWTPLHWVAYHGDTRMAKVLLNHHAKTNLRDALDRTPLLLSAFRGNEEVAALLLSNGADINARGRDGRTALDHARITLNLKLAELLRERGAKD